jgi:hypothetical protein
MFVKSLLAGALALASISGQPQLAETPMTHPYVKQVNCDKVRGTAFKVAANKYLSVNHVTQNTGCKIEGKPVFVTYNDPHGDFSIISIYDPEPGGIEISCDGFQDGGVYEAIGFARGDPQSVAILLRATKVPNLPSLLRGWSMFMGVEYVIPGMSGGAILDPQGRAVGMVNAYFAPFGLSWSRSLKDTALCPHS